MKGACYDNEDDSASKVTILTLAVAAFGEAPGASCNLRSATGAYGYRYTGAYQGQPFAAYGYVYGDGKGQVAWLGESQVEWDHPSVDA